MSEQTPTTNNNNSESGLDKRVKKTAGDYYKPEQVKEYGELKSEIALLLEELQKLKEKKQPETQAE
jgi:hypothetical protein